MKIRKARLKDQKDILDLYYNFNSKEKRKKLLPLKNFKAKLIVLIAEDKKKSVGFVHASFIDYVFYRYCYIEEFFVEKDFRNKGIGTSLINNLIKEVKKLKVNTIFVTTNKKNKNAIELYKKTGFIEDRKHLWFFQNLK